LISEEKTLNTDKLTCICAEIQSAERRAAELVMHAQGIIAESKTGRRDVVTEYDCKVQQLLMELLSEAEPGAHFFCEEQNERDSLSAAQLFIIDPIDGTMNFVHGFHHSCISIAYAEYGELLAAAVYNPYMDEMFSAVKGMGAYLNGKRISVSEAPLKESVVCFGTAPYSAALRDMTFDYARKVYDASLDLRREGSAALDLCSVAAGRAGLYFELMVSLWDYAAGVLIVNEAGGECCDVFGKDLPFDESKPTIVAGGRRAMDDFMTVTKI